MFPWILLLILSSRYCQSSASACSDNEYEKDGRCCSYCGPGQHLVSDCTEHDITVCRACSAGEYQDKYHRETRCLLHRECNEQLGFEKIREGTLTSNVDCQCQQGRHCSSEGCETCVLNTVCGEGEGVINNATRLSDTQCSPCTEGTYSDTKSDTEPCKSWRTCGDTKVIKQGTPTSDVVCEPSPSEDQSYAWVYIIVFLVILLGLVFFAKIYFMKSCRKDKNKDKQQNPPVENNQQLLIGDVEGNHPVEDQDDQDITMQGLPVAQEQGKDYHMSQEEV